MFLVKPLSNENSKQSAKILLVPPKCEIIFGAPTK